ncbi:MAG: hypothetical protein ACJ74Y_03230 [Bryobacteraceae bacterium]
MRVLGKPAEAAKLFQEVIDLGRQNAVVEESAGLAWLEAGSQNAAREHLERALSMDWLLFDSIEALSRIYAGAGQNEKLADLNSRMQQEMRTPPRPAVEMQH